MSCSLAGEDHCSLSCGDQSALKAVETAAGDSASPKLHEFAGTPTAVTWETTQACDLRCAQCRINSRPHRHPLELSTAEAFHLIDQVAEMKTSLLSLTGGDPLKRADILPIVQYAVRNGLETSLTVSTTPLLVRKAIADLKQSGLMRVAIGLDGSTAHLHDSVRGAQGSYKRMVEAIGWCHEAKLPVEVNTSVSRKNFTDLDDMIELLVQKQVALWHVFFLVPAGRTQVGDLLSAEEHEAVFAKLYEASKRVKFRIKTTEGPHYSRFVAQQQVKEGRGKASARSVPDSLGDGKAFVFVSHTGEVYPGPFLPLPAGNILWEPLADIYQHSPVFRSLRDTSQLKGKCGRCEFKERCGGSRARAYAMTNDPLAEEPCCAYTPALVPA